MCYFYVFFPLRLGLGGWLRIVIVALSGRFTYIFIVPGHRVLLHILWFGNCVLFNFCTILHCEPLTWERESLWFYCPLSVCVF